MDPANTLSRLPTSSKSSGQQPGTLVLERATRIFNIVMQVVEEFGGQLEIVSTEVEKRSNNGPSCSEKVVSSYFNAPSPF